MEGARRATPQDLPALGALAEMALDELGPTRGGPLWRRREARAQPVADTLAADLADPDRLVLAGTIDQVVLGYAVTHLERLRDGATIGIVDDIYVDPDARGVGVGEAMMDDVLEWCGARGCEGVDALALPGNRATKNFFERYGLTARAIIVHKRLSPPEATDGIDP